MNIRTTLLAICLIACTMTNAYCFKGKQQEKNAPQATALNTSIDNNATTTPHNEPFRFDSSGDDEELAKDKKLTLELIKTFRGQQEEIKGLQKQLEAVRAENNALNDSMDELKKANINLERSIRGCYGR